MNRTASLLRRLAVLAALAVFMPRQANADAEQGDLTRGRSDAPTRVVYTPTAFTLEPGRTRITVSDLSVFGIEHGFDEFLQVDFQSALPILFFGGSLWLKSTHAFTEHVRFGAYAVGCLTWSYDPEFVAGITRFLQFFGGGLVLSLGTEDLFVSLSASAFAFYGRLSESGATAESAGEHSSISPGHGWLALPGAGLSWRPVRRVSLSIEASNVVADFAEPGRVWVVIPGVRFMGDVSFVEVAAVAPIFRGVEKIMIYMPLGFPYVSFGYGF
ncbi:MAG: hypothetical protein PHU25_20070 [Deltaproteobacteria bacterium]|nr:hypothetical protein [Deltaproteobacteria bacterium]